MASLKGFVHYSLEMPGMADFDVYDERSQHCLQAHGIMRKRRALIKQLPHIDFGIIDQVILLEKLWVEPAYRGQELGLRLMQEARHLFARPQAFVILKAHPDGENVKDADCLKLADYYCSSQLLGLSLYRSGCCRGGLLGTGGPRYRMTTTRPSGGHVRTALLSRECSLKQRSGSKWVDQNR